VRIALLLFELVPHLVINHGDVGRVDDYRMGIGHVLDRAAGQQFVVQRSPRSSMKKVLNWVYQCAYAEELS
jgi:hypothetical protein